MKTIIAAAALILIGVVAWATTTTPRVAAMTSDVPEMPAYVGP